MRNIFVLTVLALIAGALVMTVGGSILPTSADTVATITTDKTKYEVGEPMTISGAGFAPDGSVTITVLRPDHETDTLPVVTADVSGAFTTIYYPPYVPGRYKIEATDGTNSARTAATEADAVGFDLTQCAQDDSKQGQPLGLGYCNWIGSALGQQNSLLYEGTATEQQLIMTGMAAGTHTLQVGIQTTKGGNHAYDWLVSDATASGTVGNSTLNSQQASAAVGTTLALHRCEDSLGNTAKADCLALVNGAAPTNTVDVPVPDDPYVSQDGSTQTRINAYEALYGNRTVRLYTNGTISGTPTMTLAHMNGKLSGSVLANGADTGDSYIWYTITWTGTGTSAMLAGAADIALGGDGTGRSWGDGRGAFGITGDPYHFYLINLDGTGGSMDNQMSGSAVFSPPETPVVTTAVHLGSNHTTDIQGTSIALGSTVHDSATVADTPNNGTPTGTVTFSWFTNGDCTGTAAATSSPLALSSGSVDATAFPQGPLAAGSYSFSAHFTSGDIALWTDADSDCEPFTVTQGTSTVTTTLHKTDHSVVAIGGSVPLGTVMHDLATVAVTPTFAAPTGNVAFTFFSNDTCD